ncbi:MAG: hypothetical protein R3C14_25935 [Caldilineaceae bacterium]
MENRPKDDEALPIIKVVGVSASGKSTLVTGLRRAGYNARPVSQEHSQIATLWQEFDPTAALIYLETNLETQQQRRTDVSWDRQWLQSERERLTHARDHADLKIDTSALTPEKVLRIAELFLTKQKLRKSDHSLPPLAATGSWQPPTPTEESPSAAESAPINSKKRKRKRQ